MGMGKWETKEWRRGRKGEDLEMGDEAVKERKEDE